MAHNQDISRREFNSEPETPIAQIYHSSKLQYLNSQIHTFKFNSHNSNHSPNMNPNRNNNSTHSLISMKDYHKPTVSRSKSRSRKITDKQEYDTKPLKPISFKAMSDNPIYEQRNRGNLQIKQKSIIPPQKHQYSKGITINVDIHNRINPKNFHNMTTINTQYEPTPKIDRTVGMINNDRKSKKTMKFRPDPEEFDLQCTQQLSFHSKRNIKSETIIKDKYNESSYLEENNARSKTQAPKLLTKLKQKPLLVTPDPKDLLQKFEKQAGEIQANFDYEALLYLDTRQASYMVKPNYIEKKQKNFTWVMRAVVIEWMMQVCYEFSLKRETFFISVNLFDRYLEKEYNLQKSDFQLVGAASMFIASKLEEEQPKTSGQFVKTANGSYSAKLIKEMERKISNTLQYQLNPPTLFRWANLLMAQWDNYLKENSYAKVHPLFSLKDFFYFKQADQNAYIHFRSLVQLIDCSILEIQTYEYNPKLLVCSFIYLLMGKQMQIFDARQIPKFYNHSQYLLDEQNLLNDLFENFLDFTFNIRLTQLLPIIQYCSTFFTLPPNFDQPIIPSAEQAQKSMQLQQYCSFQTFDKNMLIIIKKRFKGIYFDR